MASSVKVSYSSTRASVDPAEASVMIVGQVGNLKRVSFDDVKNKIGKRVEADTWKEAVKGLTPSPTDSVNLYLNKVTLCSLPVKCSRHNTPSRAHALAKILKPASKGQKQFVIIVCERADVYASGTQCYN